MGSGCAIISVTTFCGGAAAGYRNNSNGNLNNVGSIGYYWSATVTGGNSYNLNFNSNSGNINPSNNNNRANGFSVRCVAAFTK